jgi:hypothetical protein
VRVEEVFGDFRGVLEAFEEAVVVVGGVESLDVIVDEGFD